MLIISNTTAWTPAREAIFRIFFPSKIVGFPLRLISLSLPSGNIKQGLEPVVFASTRIRDSLRHAVISRTTLDFPLVPVTHIRKGI
jgi:hypothetical protein